MVCLHSRACILHHTIPSKQKMQSRCHVITMPIAPTDLVSHRCRRQVLASSVVSIIIPSLAWAGDMSNETQDENVVGAAFKSLFDPNEKTKSGKVLPKAYLRSARELVKTLRESLNEDPKDAAKFRRTADAAKESIRDYLSGWRGQQTVVNEESYMVIEKAIRSLASFYAMAGPSAPLPEKVKSEVLINLERAEEFL